MWTHHGATLCVTPMNRFTACECKGKQDNRLTSRTSKDFIDKFVDETGCYVPTQKTK